MKLQTQSFTKRFDKLIPVDGLPILSIDQDDTFTSVGPSGASKAMAFPEPPIYIAEMSGSGCHKSLGYLEFTKFIANRPSVPYPEQRLEIR